MNLQQAKEELIKRYKYLYLNAPFILAPYMHEQTQNELEKYNKKHKIKREKPLITLELTDNNTLYIFEEFLLSNIKMEESTLYKTIELNRNNIEYLKKVQKGYLLVEKTNTNRNKFLKITLDISDILSRVYDNIFEQSANTTNIRKLKVIDEYYRIYRYQNDGKTRISGHNLSILDVSSVSIPLHNTHPIRNNKTANIENNEFINLISNRHKVNSNGSHFTEAEKQSIYLEFHDELPWNLEITCDIEEEYIKTLIETRLSRPENTIPCKEKFYIKEEEIFINPNDKLYRYYQLCPHCGYIVNIPKEILSEGIKQRIEERCQKDPYLFRKMFLYSELKKLDDISVEGNKKILKNNR